MKNILVVCTGNSCRSQILHGYLRDKLKLSANIFSAGTETHGLNPNAVLVMKMDNIDISSNTSNLIQEYADINFDFIITVCDHANEACPNVLSSSAIRIHKNFEDPSKLSYVNDDKKLDSYIFCRNQIKNFCEGFIEDFFNYS